MYENNPRDEDLAAALERVADAAEDGARVQGRVAQQARDAARQARAGTRAGTWSDGGGARLREILDTLSGSTDRLVRAAGELRRSWAGAMSAEGMTARQIAGRLGISHQRVSVLLGRPLTPPGV